MKCSLRGASPPERLKFAPDYFIQLGYDHSSRDIYRPFISLMHEKEKNNPLSLKRIILSELLPFPIEKFPRIMIASSLQFFDMEKDLTDITIFVEDKINYVFRIKGLCARIKAIIQSLQ